MSTAKTKIKESEKPKRENILARPRVDRVLVSCGIGGLITKKGVDEAAAIRDGSQILSAITGQKPKVVRAKKSVAGFKVREGMPVHLLVTLRGKRATAFLHRLVAYALPRDTSFPGLKKNNLDASGNLNLGIREANSFPEAMSDAIKITYGIGVTVIVKAKHASDKVELYKKLGFPVKI